MGEKYMNSFLAMRREYGLKYAPIPEIVFRLCIAELA
jgi:hypothetical protein